MGPLLLSSFCDFTSRRYFVYTRAEGSRLQRKVYQLSRMDRYGSNVMTAEFTHVLIRTCQGHETVGQERITFTNIRNGF
jgi:hypothetical protein